MKPISKRAAFLATVPALLVLTACPSEPQTEEAQSLAPAPIEGTANQQSSVIDEVEVMGVDEAVQQAEEEINESNVLDALEDLEKEIDGN